MLSLNKALLRNDINPHPFRTSNKVHNTHNFYGLHIIEGDESSVDYDEPINYQEAKADLEAATLRLLNRRKIWEQNKVHV